jgi:hypothetical protein
MHRLFRDALNSALQKLGFPWLTPHPTKTSREIGYFQKSITPNDLYELYKRNPDGVDKQKQSLTYQRYSNNNKLER